MKNIYFKIFVGFAISFIILQCNRDEVIEPINSTIDVKFPSNFPERNPAFKDFKVTKFGVELGEKLFEDKRLSKDNTIACATCHKKENAYADQGKAISPGVDGLLGFRNAPPLQNLYWLKDYMWEGAVTNLELQPIIPITTDQEMCTTISSVISKIKDEKEYQDLFYKVYGDSNINANRILNAITQYELTLVSSDSKYDKVKRNEGETFTAEENQGYQTFQQKCANCHSTEIFTDNTFRNVGFPKSTLVDGNGNPEEGRMRVTGIAADYMKFRNPSLRNVEYTAPYGSFGQFATLKDVLDYFDNGVLSADNLDPILKNNGNKIPLTEEEKTNLIAFMKTLSDKKFVGK